MADEAASQVTDDKAERDHHQASIAPPIAANAADDPKPKKHDSFDWVNLIVLILTFAAAAGAAVEAKRLADATDRLVTDARNASDGQARLTRESNKINRQAFTAVQRAFVIVTNMNAQAIYDAKNTLMGWRFAPVIENSGNTPTRNLKYNQTVTSTNVDYANPKTYLWTEDPDFGTNWNADLPHALIGPKETIPAPFVVGGGFGFQPLNEIHEGKFFGIVQGVIHYDDVLSEDAHHVTRYCFFIDQHQAASTSPPTFRLCPIHNCADEECEREDAKRLTGLKTMPK